MSRPWKRRPQAPPVSAGIGTAVISGHQFVVTSVYMTDGKIHFVCKANGPLPAVEDAEIMFFGLDGTGIYQHPGTATWSRCPTGAVQVVDVPMKVIFAEKVSR